MTIYHYAVIGNPIEHSLSPTIHQYFAKQNNIALHYEKIQGDTMFFEKQVDNFFAAGGSGLNITMPFKQRAYEMAQVKTTRCIEAKAANTLWKKSGQLYADNTDGIGFMRDLTHYFDVTDKTILLLGAGGASRGIIGPLLNASVAKLTVMNRTIAERTTLLLQDFPQINCISTIEQLDSAYDMVIHATSAHFISTNSTENGIEKNALYLPTFIWQTHPFCYDLAYCADKPTPFVASALQQGCIAVDGLGMLVEQAAEAFYIWHGVMPNTANLKITYY